MNYEEKYWELKENLDRAYDVYCAHPTSHNFIEKTKTLGAFSDFCVSVLEKLMDENSDVLARLK